MAELPLELGGSFAYNHDDWIQNRTVSIFEHITEILFVAIVS
jgi:hypothetical protein